MYCNEKKIAYWKVTFICTVLFRLEHCFDLGQYVIKPLKPNLFLDIVHCPLTGGYFRPCGTQIDVRVRLGEVSAYGKLKV